MNSAMEDLHLRLLVELIALFSQLKVLPNFLSRMLRQDVEIWRPRAPLFSRCYKFLAELVPSTVPSAVLCIISGDLGLFMTSSGAIFPFHFGLELLKRAQFPSETQPLEQRDSCTDVPIRAYPAGRELIAGIQRTAKSGCAVKMLHSLEISNAGVSEGRCRILDKKIHNYKGKLWIDVISQPPTPIEFQSRQRQGINFSFQLS